MNKTIYIVSCFVLFQNFAFAQNLVWAKHLTGPATYQVQAAALAPNGDLISTGSFSGTIDFDPNDGVTELTADGNYDQFVLRTDPNGDFVWVMQFGSYGYPDPIKVVTDVDDNIYVAGIFTGSFDADPSAATATLTASGSQSVFVAKYNAARELQWANKIDNTDYVSFTSLLAKGDDGAYVSGIFKTSLSINDVEDVSGLGSVNKGFLIKFDASTGAFEWSGYHSDNAVINHLAFNNTGQIMAAGQYFASCDVDFDESEVEQLNGNASRDAFLTIYEPDRTFVSAMSIGASGYDAAHRVAEDGDGNIILAGEYFTQINCDLAGSGPGQLTTAGFTDGCFIAKYTPDFEFIWARQLGKSSDTFIYDLAIGPDNHVYTTGTFDGSANMDPTSPETNQMLTAQGALDGFLSRLDADGNYVYGGQFTGPYYEENAVSILFDGNGGFYISGNFMSTIDVDPGNNTVEFAAAGSTDSFITKWNGFPVSSTGSAEIPGLEVFPNPSSGAFTLRAEIALNQADIWVLNMHGQSIPFELHRGGVQVDLDIHAPAGLYHVVITQTDGKVSTQKVLITHR
jgi:hypothetical protein